MTYSLWSQSNNGYLWMRSSEVTQSMRLDDSADLQYTMEFLTRFLYQQSTGLVREVRARRPRTKPSFFPCSLYRLQAEAMAQIRCGFSQFKRSGLKVCLTTFKIWIRSRFSYFKLVTNLGALFNSYFI